MKKMMSVMFVIGLLCVIGFAGAEKGQAAAKTEMRPLQKTMQARSGWIKDMTVNLEAKKYSKVKKDAKALASQTGAMGKKIPNPLAKELTLKVSTLATAMANAAGKKDGETAKMKLAELKATCDECHAKIRDKK
jgi:hypothetical protein